MKSCCHLNLNVSLLLDLPVQQQHPASSLVHACQLGFGQICYKTLSLQSHRHHFVTYFKQTSLHFSHSSHAVSSNIEHLVQLKVYVTFLTPWQLLFPPLTFPSCQPCHLCQIITRSPWPALPPCGPEVVRRSESFERKVESASPPPSTLSSFKWTHCRCFHASRCFHFSAPCSCFLLAHIHMGHIFDWTGWMSCSLASLLTKWSNVKQSPFTGCLNLIPSNHQSWYC